MQDLLFNILIKQWYIYQYSKVADQKKFTHIYNNLQHTDVHGH